MQLKEYEKEFYSQPNFDFEHSKKRFDRALELIGRGKSVLDVGCWGGDTSEVIKERGNTVTAIDISETSVIRAKEKGLDAFVCDITEGLDFDDESFDVAYMGDVIEHLFDEESALLNVHRVLKPGGKLILTTVNICSLRDRILVSCGHVPAYYGVHRDHIRMFNKKKLTQLLEDTGFKINRFEGLTIELPYTPSGRKIVLDRITKRFATFATHFIVEAEK